MAKTKKKSSTTTNYKETEMEDIARVAREFREQETKRIAEEKEETRIAYEQQKRLERERIALQTGQFRDDTAKEQAALSRLKEVSSQQQQDLLLGTDVSGKAKRLLEKEALERKRRKDERQFESKKSHSSDSNADYESLASFSSDVEAEAGETSSEPNKLLGTRPSSIYYDAAMRQSTLDNGEEDQLERTGSAYKKQETHESVYFDATSSDPESSSEYGESNINSETPTLPSQATPSSKADQSMVFETPQQASAPVDPNRTRYFDAHKAGTEGSSQRPVQSAPPTGFKTPRQFANKVETTSRASVYYDARGAQPAVTFEDSVSSAGVQARALFTKKGGDPLVSEGDADMTPNSAFNPIEDQSIVARESQPIHQKAEKARETASEFELLEHIRIQKASFEIPLEYSSEDGFNVLSNAEVNMSTSMPPSRVNGRWSGSLEGKSSLAPSPANSSASGSVSFDYRANSWGKLSFGMIRGHEVLHPLMSIGGSLIRQGSVVGVHFYHNASFLHMMMLEHPMYSLSFRHLFPNSRWLFSSELSRQQELSLGISNSKVATRLAWSLRSPKEVTGRLDMYPRISEDRKLHLFGERKVGVWHIGASIIQSLHSQVATVGLGIRLFSARGLEWILSWSRGDATIRIPIVVTSGLTNVHLGHALYFSAISFLIQEGIAEVWGWKAVKESDQEETLSTTVMSKAKAHQAAELQKGLMARQAKRKTRIETEKEGLVVHMATYSVDGGDEWDATVPLQFWVNQSSLTLPPKSKSLLLGFYDISQEKTEDGSSQSPTEKTSKWWWRNLLDDLLDVPAPLSSSKEIADSPKPTLTIRYDFQGQAYEIRIDDEQELILPNPTATRL